MKQAKDTRLVANDVNDTILKQIESLIEDFSNRWYYQIIWNWIMNKELQEEIEFYWYLINKMSWHQYIISRRKIKWEKI